MGGGEGGGGARRGVTKYTIVPYFPMYKVSWVMQVFQYPPYICKASGLHQQGCNPGFQDKSPGPKPCAGSEGAWADTRSIARCC